MTRLRTVRMVERPDGGYRSASSTEIQRMVERGTVRLEGVDGDEDKNLVTRWYTRDVNR